MINTNSIVFKVVSCVASALVAVGATVLVSNKVYRDGFFTFKTPAVTVDVAKKVLEEAEKKAAEKKAAEERAAKIKELETKIAAAAADSQEKIELENQLKALKGEKSN